MPTRNIVLTDHQADLLERRVSSGRYQNASEVLREGLRLIVSRQSEDAARPEALRSAVQAGIHVVSAGRFRDFESAEALAHHLGALCYGNPPAEVHRPTSQVNAPGARWRLRLTATAEADFGDIPLWTRSRFGDWAARHFARTLALKSREQSVGTRSRAAFAPCLWPGQGAADDISSSSGFRARPRTG